MLHYLSISYPSYMTMGKLLASLSLSFLIHQLGILTVNNSLNGYEHSMKKIYEKCLTTVRFHLPSVPCSLGKWN